MYIHKCTNKKTLEGGAHMEVTEVRIKERLIQKTE